MSEVLNMGCKQATLAKARKLIGLYKEKEYAYMNMFAMHT